MEDFVCAIAKGDSGSSGEQKRADFVNANRGSAQKIRLTLFYLRRILMLFGCCAQATRQHVCNRDLTKPGYWSPSHLSKLHPRYAYLGIVSLTRHQKTLPRVSRTKHESRSASLQIFSSSVMEHVLLFSAFVERAIWGLKRESQAGRTPKETSRTNANDGCGKRRHRLSA